jgi:hypothetical protein
LKSQPGLVGADDLLNYSQFSDNDQRLPDEMMLDTSKLHHMDNTNNINLTDSENEDPNSGLGIFMSSFDFPSFQYSSSSSNIAGKNNNSSSSSSMQNSKLRLMT